MSHLLAIKRKTLFLKIELNAFSNRGHIYDRFEKKSNISKINEMGEENKSIYKKTTVLRYERLKFWDRFS